MPDDKKLSEFVFEPLQEKHDRAAFSCGVETLDVYLKTQAGQDLRKRAAVPFVITPDGTKIAGYYTLSQYAIALDVVPPELAKRLPKYQMVPVTLLGRLAIDVKFRGLKLGAALLLDGLSRSLRLSTEIASAGVIVDAINDSAVAFYTKYGFLELPRIERRLFLPMATIARSLSRNPST